MLNIAVVDDEPQVAREMEALLLKIFLNFNIEVNIDLFYTGEEIISELNQEIYHILFLDIEMGICNGIIVSKHLRETLMNEITQIIYVSGKNEYDRQLFEFRPFFFLEKPVKVDVLKDVMKKYVGLYLNKQDLFGYRQGHDTSYIEMHAILYFESNGRRIKIQTTTEEIYYYGTLRDIMDQLENKGFFSPHKSYVVNYRFVKTFKPTCLVLTNGECIPVSKSRRTYVSKKQLEIEKGEFVFGN